MIFSKFGSWEDFSKEMTKALTMIVMYMRKIFAFLFLTIGVLACTPQELPPEDEVVVSGIGGATKEGSRAEIFAYVSRRSAL